MRASNTLCVSLALALLLASAPVQVAALSWPLCDDGGSVWVTQRPRTEPTFPGSDLWFFCESGMNILGNSISPCIKNGTICNVNVADTICELLGYDKAFGDDLTVVTAAPGEPVVSLTGEFCLREGVYSTVVPDNLASVAGEPCSKIKKITCIRSLDKLNAALVAGLQNATLAAISAAPAAEDLATTARLAQQQAKQAGAAGAAHPPRPAAMSAAPVAEMPVPVVGP